MARRSRAAAQETRQAILDRASALGSVEGLEALSLGRLAADLHLSKSGVIGHFDAKEHLQVQAVETAAAHFTGAVWAPVAGEPEGLPRLRAAMASWLAYLDGNPFPGGCFLTAAAHEYDDRPGPVRDAIVTAWRRWHAALRHDAARAIDAGDLADDRTPEQLVFVLNALVVQANFSRRLLGDADAMDRARAEVARVLGQPLG